jgi:hypothetical protein
MIDRRQLIQILGAGAAACAGPAPASPLAASTFFTTAEQRTVDRLCELLIPADPSGSGAHDAGVAAYIDLVLQYSAPAVRDAWRNGIASVERAANAEFGRGAADCTEAEMAKLMDGMAAGERAPESDIEKYFVRLKALAVQGYALSEQGRKALGYRGDQMLHEFTGCNHPDHHRA